MFVNTAIREGKQLQGHLTCPVSKEKLSEAVLLLPCTHRVQETVMKGYFPADQSNSVSQEVRCPISDCGKEVVSWEPDEIVRSIANGIVFTDEREQELLPFPGEKAIFDHKKGDWEEVDFGGDLCRRIKFRSTTTDSTIKNFSILGWKDGDISIQISFSPERKKDLESFCEQHGVIFEDGLGCSDNTFRTKGTEQLKKMFEILVDNNEIPSEWLEKVNEIVAQGKMEKSSLPQRTGLPRGLEAMMLMHMLEGEMRGRRHSGLRDEECSIQ